MDKVYVVKGETGDFFGEFTYHFKNFENVRKVFDKEVKKYLETYHETWEENKYNAPVSTYDEWIDYLVNEEHEFGDVVYWMIIEFDDEKFE